MQIFPGTVLVIIYHPAARKEYDRQVARLMKRPFTTRVVANFIEEIESAEKAILSNPDRFPLRCPVSFGLARWRLAPVVSGSGVCAFPRRLHCDLVEADRRR